MIIINTISFAQVNDGGFENWTNSTNLADWVIENDVSQNITDMSEGLSCASLKIGADNLNPKVTTQVALVNGTLYNVSFKYKYVNTNFSGTHSVCIKLVKSGSATTITACTSPTDNNWGTRTTTFTPDQTGDYELSLSTSNFFDEQSFEILIDEVIVNDPNTAGTSNIINESDFNLHPTLTDRYLYFNKDILKTNPIISIFDIYGKKQQVKTTANEIDLSTLIFGIYFVNLKSDRFNTTIKIIKI